MKTIMNSPKAIEIVIAEAVKKTVADANGKISANDVINAVVDNPEGVIAKRFALYIELGKEAANKVIAEM